MLQNSPALLEGTVLGCLHEHAQPYQWKREGQPRHKPSEGSLFSDTDPKVKGELWRTMWSNVRKIIQEQTLETARKEGCCRVLGTVWLHCDCLACPALACMRWVIEPRKSLKNEIKARHVDQVCNPSCRKQKQEDQGVGASLSYMIPNLTEQTTKHRPKFQN